MIKDLFGIFSKKPASKDVAKERLQLVLVHDRANVDPDLLEKLRAEIMQVISKYMEIQVENLDIQITKTKSDDGSRVVPALVANIPIKSLKK